MNSKVVSPPGTTIQGSVVPAQERVFRFTPGPWEVRESMGGKSVQARHPMTAGLPNATGYIVLANPAPHGKEHAAEREATLRLIAAATDLIAALAEITTACEADCGIPDDGDEDDEPVGGGDLGPMALTFGMLRRARAAIAKATAP